jgi:2,3-bisphosphoglycerate-independent phosphoglycerate mutase
MSPEHLVALRRFTSKYAVQTLWHFFTDGRDSPPYAARDLWAQFKSSIMGKNSYVATLSGRLYLDRKKQWSRTEKLYNALVLGRAQYQYKDVETAISDAYKRGESDEFIEPTIIRNQEVVTGDVISDNDAIIFFNLRSDRARQLAKPFVQEQFEQLNQGAFKRAKVLRNTHFVAMTDFGPDLGPVLTAFPSRDVSNTLPMVLGSLYKQAYVAETEKYAHITYFLNGGFTAPIAGEDRILIRSKEVKSYDEAPQMSCEEITDIALKSLTRKWYNFVGLNYANADMLGHTGNIQAAIIGCAFVDKQIARLVKFIQNSNGILIITADHGNAEYMGHQDNESGKSVVDTMHETNPVPFIVVSEKDITLKGQGEEEPGGKLGDVAPTLLDLIGIEKPAEMTGESLVMT